MKKSSCRFLLKDDPTALCWGQSFIWNLAIDMISFYLGNVNVWYMWVLWRCCYPFVVLHLKKIKISTFTSSSWQNCTVLLCDFRILYIRIITVALTVNVFRVIVCVSCGLWWAMCHVGEAVLVGNISRHVWFNINRFSLMQNLKWKLSTNSLFNVMPPSQDLPIFYGNEKFWLVTLQILPWKVSEFHSQHEFPVSFWLYFRQLLFHIISVQQHKSGWFFHTKKICCE